MTICSGFAGPGIVLRSLKQSTPSKQQALGLKCLVTRGPHHFLTPAARAEAEADHMALCATVQGTASHDCWAGCPAAHLVGATGSAEGPRRRDSSAFLSLESGG